MINTFLYHDFEVTLNGLKNKSIILFGASGFGKEVMNYLVDFGMNIAFFCDNDQKRQGQYFQNIEVKSPMDLVSMDLKNFKIIICSMYFEQISNQLINMGIADFIFFSRKMYRSYFDDDKGFEKNKDRIEACLDILEDDLSKKTLLNVIKYSISENESFLKEIYTKNQYFPHDIINIGKNETFLDLGAYDGDTTRQFLSRVEEYRHIYLFEPQKSYCEKIKSLFDDEKIVIINCGVYDENTTMKFVEQGTASFIYENWTNVENLKAVGFKGLKIDNEEELEIVKVVRIDDFFRDEKVTFIKMDIEGTEKKALKGARNVILRDKPKLAICVYHDFVKHTDLWEIPLYLKSVLSEYKIYIRHHSMNISETVCYAVS